MYSTLIHLNGKMTSDRSYGLEELSLESGDLHREYVDGFREFSGYAVILVGLGAQLLQQAG